MTKTIEFYYDYGSPTCYLADTQIGAVAAAAGAEIDFIPVLLGGIFKATGNQSPVAVPAKGKYMGRDLGRFVKRYGVPFRFNQHFPVNTIGLMRGAVYAKGTGHLAPYSAAMYRAMWVDNVDLNDPAKVAETITAAGLDAARFGAAIQDQAVKDQLKKNTEEAVQRGAFGAPTFFVGDEMFWGQDRLDQVAEAL